MEVCPIYRQARLNPDAVAVEWSDGHLTYAALDGLVRVVEARLAMAGIGNADRIGLVLPNSWQYVVLVQALFRIKAIAVPLSTRFTAEMVDNLPGMTGCKAVVGWKGKDDVVSLELTELVNLEDRGDDQSSEAIQEPMIDLDQPATILFSSGSTGMPKAILHTWGNHYFNALGSNENIVVSPADRWLLSLPLYHVAGQAIMFRCLIAGAAVVLPQQEKSLLDTLQESAITHVSFVSTQLLRLLDDMAGRTSLPALKNILLGGSAISRGLITRAFERGLPIHTSYGMTEMGSQVSTTAAGATLEELFTSGHLLQFRNLKIDDKGQVLVRGKTRFAGLVTGPGENDLVDVFDDAGWYATGDLGRLDEKGRLVVLGRKDNMFISGGENIYPEEIERVLEQHESVRRAIVVPVPDREFGYRPVAFLDIAYPKLEADMYEAHLTGRISRFMQPVAYFDLDTGEEEMKISRKVLQEAAREKIGV